MQLLKRVLRIIVGWVIVAVVSGWITSLSFEGLNKPWLNVFADNLPVFFVSAILGGSIAGLLVGLWCRTDRLLILLGGSAILWGSLLVSNAWMRHMVEVWLEAVLSMCAAVTVCWIVTRARVSTSVRL